VSALCTLAAVLCGWHALTAGHDQAMFVLLAVAFLMAAATASAARQARP
jgi:hypothetical protein